jgi:CheY-like chemotaxis protein
MTDVQREPEAVPEAFVGRVKDALEHLYDLSYLQHHPLAQQDGVAPGSPSEIAGQHLRREVAAAIEALNPGAGVPFLAPHARLYNLIRLRYVEGMTVREAGHELGLSLRQTHRELRRGEEGVAEVLWARRSASPSQEPRAVQLSSFQAEMSRLATRPQPTDVHALLQRAQEAVARLAAQRHVGFHTHIPPEPAIISTDPVVAEQILVNILSYAIQQSCEGALELELTSDERQASLTLRFFPETETTGTPAIDLVVAQLIDRLGWTWTQEDHSKDTRVVTLHMTARGPTVLVIDDNAGLVELLERYLTDQACRVMVAMSGEEGLRLVQEAPPDAIILDVMMPGMHGWEFLQRLRNQPVTSHTPVIVCSVINNPDLAYSLGASLFLPKPVNRQDILDALCQLGVV